MKKAEEYNIKPERIHIDPLVEMLCTSEDGIAINVEVISTIRKEYPTIHIILMIHIKLRKKTTTRNHVP